MDFRFIKEAYNQGVMQAIHDTKVAAEGGGTENPDKDHPLEGPGRQGSGQTGVPSVNFGPGDVQKIMKTTTPFGDSAAVAQAKQNLTERFTKRDDLSHGDSSTTVGEGTNN